MVVKLRQISRSYSQGYYYMTTSKENELAK